MRALPPAIVARISVKVRERRDSLVEVPTSGWGGDEDEEEDQEGKDVDGNQDDDNEEDEEGDEGAAAPSSLPAPALIMGAAVTNFHVVGAAPQIAQGETKT